MAGGGTVKNIDGERTVFIPDLHCPFHDEKAIGATLEFVKWFKPQTLIFLGDVIDFYAISHFKRDPSRRLQLQSEIDTGQAVLSSYRKVSPTSKTFYLKGNHEARLQSYLWTTAPELSSLRSLQFPELIGLEKFHIKWVESGSMMIGAVLAKHGNIVRQHSCYSARAEMERNGVSGVSGHTHRLGQPFKRNRAGNFCWVESGCLCDMEKVEYMEGQTADWQHGLTVGFFKKDSGRFSMSPISIIHGKLLFDMKEFYV